jgi:hypothetical protein
MALPSEPWTAIRSWAAVSGAILDSRDEALQQANRCIAKALAVKTNAASDALLMGEAVIWLAVAMEACEMDISTCISKALLKKMKEL